jgi:hypothetical protein
MSSIPVSLNDKFAELLKIVKELNPSQYEAVNAKYKEAAAAINSAVRTTITLAIQQEEAEKCAECSEPAVKMSLSVSSETYAKIALKAASELCETLNKDQLTALWDDWVGTVFEDSSCESMKDVKEAIVSQVNQYFENLDDMGDEKCVECGEAVHGEEGWRDDRLRLFCDDCKKYELEYGAEDEECPGDEADYDYEPCCDTDCKCKGHYYKKTEADKTDGRTDGEDEDEEERKWASHFVKNEALSS